MVPALDFNKELVTKSFATEGFVFFLSNLEIILLRLLKIRIVSNLFSLLAIRSKASSNCSRFLSSQEHLGRPFFS